MIGHRGRRRIAAVALLGLAPLSGCAQPGSSQQFVQPYSWASFKVPSSAPAGAMVDSVVIAFGGNALRATGNHYFPSFRAREITSPTTIAWSKPAGILGRGSETGFAVHVFESLGRPCWASITWYMVAPNNPPAPHEAAADEGPRTGAEPWPHC